MSDTDIPPELEFGIDLASVKARLEGLGYFLSVTDLSDAVEALEKQAAFYPPAAFVSISSETPEPNRIISHGDPAPNFHQRTRVTLSILFVERTARADGKKTERVEKTRRAIIRQLLAWRPEGATRYCEYQGYALRATGDGMIWGEVKMVTEYDLTLT